jgi:antitoxin component YwqK of YwqJK toxin-antitoxin module
MLKSETCYDNQGKVNSKQTYQFNSDNKLIQLHDYGADGKLKVTIDYNYDNKGSLVAYKLSGDVNHQYKLKYLSFDAKGNWTSMLSYEDGKIDQLTKRKIIYY